MTAPSQQAPKKWLVIFEGSDRGIASFQTEVAARQYYARAVTQWTCMLLAPASVVDGERSELAAALERIRYHESERDNLLLACDNHKAEIERGYQMLSAYGVPRERAKDIGNGIDVLATRFGKEIAALQSWKAEQLAVEATWDEQAIGKALGLSLGSPIRAQILPSIAALRQRLEQREKASKDGWTAFYKLRRWAAEHKFPGLDGVVSAALAAEPAASQIRACDGFTVDGQMKWADRDAEPPAGQEGMDG